jgi:hypothetical protein
LTNLGHEISSSDQSGPKKKTRDASCDEVSSHVRQVSCIAIEHSQKSSQVWGKGTIVAIAGTSAVNDQELWIGKCVKHVPKEQHSFEVAWMEEKSPSERNVWVFTGQVDHVFRNSVIGTVCVESWEQKRTVCHILEEEFSRLATRLPEFPSLTARGATTVDLHTPQTPVTLPTSPPTAEQLFNFLVHIAKIPKEV